MVQRISAQTSGRVEVVGAPFGGDVLWLGERTGAGGSLIHVVRDDARMAATLDAYAFFHPDLRAVGFPAWDCLPYDRVSPNSDVISRRVAALASLAEAGNGRLVVVTTANAIVQRLPPPETFLGAVWQAARGDTIDRAALTTFLLANGYGRAETVREPGEFALRGGIIDLYPPGQGDPVRFDLFGDTVNIGRGAGSA